MLKCDRCKKVIKDGQKHFTRTDNIEEVLGATVFVRESKVVTTLCLKCHSLKNVS